MVAWEATALPLGDARMRTDFILPRSQTFANEFDYKTQKWWLVNFAFAL
jgi:hypothetical protein